MIELNGLRFRPTADLGLFCCLMFKHKLIISYYSF